MDERNNYYVNRERISECEFGDSNFLDELKTAYAIFLENTSRKGKIREFKNAIKKRWETVQVGVLLLC